MTLHNHVLHQLQLQVLGDVSPSFAHLVTDFWLFCRAAQVQVRIDAEHMWKSIFKSLPWFLKWICMWALSGPVSVLVCVLNFPSRILQVSFSSEDTVGPLLRLRGWCQHTCMWSTNQPVHLRSWQSVHWCLRVEPCGKPKPSVSTYDFHCGLF